MRLLNHSWVRGVGNGGDILIVANYYGILDGYTIRRLK